MISIPKGFQKYIEVLSDKTLVSILSSTNKGNHDYKIICWDIEGRQLLNDYMFSLDSQSILPLIRGEILRDQKTLLMEANVDLWDKKRKNKKSIRRLLFWSVSEFKMLCEYDFVTGCGNCSSSYLLAYPDNRTTLIVINAKCEENEEKHLILLYWDSQEQRIVRELTVKIDNTVEYLQGIELSPDRTELLTTLKKRVPISILR